MLGFGNLTLLSMLGSTLVLAPSGSVPVHLPSLGELVAAASSRDDVELERVASRLGSARLGRVAAATNRRPEERLAALRALPLVEGSWSTLEGLIAIFGEADDAIADAAAETTRRVAENLTPELAEREEVPRDVPKRAARLLLDKALEVHLAASRRVSALFAAVALRRLTSIDEGSIMGLLKDEHIEVRRAAAEALSNIPAAEKALSDTLTTDGSVLVAAASATSLCRDVPVTGKEGPAFARAAKLPPLARERLRALAVDEAVPLLDRLELLPCLRAAAVPTDQQVLDGLAKGGPESLRRKARTLGGR